MKLIAWDTSSKTGALVALEWNTGKNGDAEPYKIVSEWALNVDAGQHSEKLLWAIHQMLEACNWRLEEIDYFGVGVGPGSFTGLRIGITTARTLAHTLRKPLIGISSLAALARPAALQFSSAKERVVIIASTDAAKGELFVLHGAARGILDCIVPSDPEQAGHWKRGVDEVVSSAENLKKALKKKITEGKGKSQWIRIGEGRNRYPDLWKALPKNLETESALSEIHQIQGRSLGALAWEAIQAGLESEPLKVHPRYLRASDAENKLAAGLLKPSPRSK